MSTSTLSATPMGPVGRPRRGLVLATALLLALSLFGAYQVGVRERRPPSFSRGGAFQAGSRLRAENSPSDKANPASPEAAAASTPAGGGLTASPSNGAASGSGAATVAGAPATGSTATTAAGAAPGSSGAPGGGPASGQPALGTYTYDITGTEAVTGFGSRSFPPTMTITAHKAAGLAADEVDFDLDFSSDHTEREIVAYRNHSVDLDYEAGSIRFGPMTQTDEGSYVPPMSIIPLAGTTLSGSSAAQTGGTTSRVEDWTTTVTGSQVVTVGGRALQCIVVKVHRQTRPGYSDQETRDTTYWYSPALHTWVKWAQTMHGQRNYGVTFTYDEQFTATLAGFASA